MIKTKLNYLLILTMLLPTFVMASPDTTTTVKCPEVRIEVEQLPDLNIPRAGHEVFCVNGELTVAGGHTTRYRTDLRDGNLRPSDALLQRLLQLAAETCVCFCS